MALSSGSRRSRWLPAFMALAAALVGAQPTMAIDPVDVLVLYTPLARENLGGSPETIEAAIEAEFVEANEVFGHSHLDPSMYYRLTDIQEICFEERGKIRMDLQWLHENLEVAARREATGSDAVLLLTGTANYGGMAWAIYSDSASQREHAFLTVESFALGTLSVGHELGHTLGAAHNPEILVLPDPPMDSNYGYIHWEEEPYFRTLMAYATFPDPDGNGQYTCSECAENQLNAFSSPDLWYMHAGPGLTFNQVCTLRDNLNGTHAVQCANGASGSIPSNDLSSYGEPLGTSLHNNREQIEGRWDITAAYLDPPIAAGLCEQDCDALSRATCTTAGGACGGCLPHYAETADGLCLAAITPTADSSFANGCYANNDSFAPSDGAEIAETIDLGSSHTLERVDLHFGTYAVATGEPSFAWAPNSFSNWSPPAPPEYNWELEASPNGANWTALASGSRDTPAESLIGAPSGHHMMWRAWQREEGGSPITARFLRVTIAGCPEQPCDYSVGLHELSAHGTATAAVPALPLVSLPLLILAFAGSAWLLLQKKQRPSETPGHG